MKEPSRLTGVIPRCGSAVGVLAGSGGCSIPADSGRDRAVDYRLPPLLPWPAAGWMEGIASPQSPASSQESRTAASCIRGQHSW